MPASETAAHARLKALALAWVREQGFSLAAAEVRVPRSGFRADVAAGRPNPDGRTVILECKQSRADLLRDAHPEAASRARLAELGERRRRLEELLAVHRPDLRRGEAFWPEYDAWDFSRLEHRGYRRLLGDLATAGRRVREGTKFSRMARYRCADFLYLVVDADIFAPAEIPAGWGLLVASSAGLVLARPAPALAATAERRAGLQRAVAWAAARPPSGSTSVPLAPTSPHG